MSDNKPFDEEEVEETINNDSSGIHEAEEEDDAIVDSLKGPYSWCPNLSEIITRMMSEVATGVMVKVPGKKNKTYIWQKSLEREKIMLLLDNPPSGSVWDTLVSKALPEITQSGTTQASDMRSKVKENSKQ